MDGKVFHEESNQFTSKESLESNIKKIVNVPRELPWIKKGLIDENSELTSP
jgi:hypothetical protein